MSFSLYDAEYKLDKVDLPTETSLSSEGFVSHHVVDSALGFDYTHWVFNIEFDSIHGSIGIGRDVEDKVWMASFTLHYGEGEECLISRSEWIWGENDLDGWGWHPHC